MTVAINLRDLPPDVRAKLPKPLTDAGHIQRRTKNKLAAAIRQAQDELRRESFCKMLAMAHLPQPTMEYQFHETREWRFDFAWLKQKVALEVEGGVWIQGRHSRGQGMLADMEKYNTATLMGWRVLRVTPEHLYGRATEKMLKAVLK